MYVRLRARESAHGADGSSNGSLLTFKALTKPNPDLALATFLHLPHTAWLQPLP